MKSFFSIYDTDGFDSNHIYWIVKKYFVEITKIYKKILLIVFTDIISNFDKRKIYNEKR